MAAKKQAESDAPTEYPVGVTIGLDAAGSTTHIDGVEYVVGDDGRVAGPA